MRTPGSTTGSPRREVLGMKLSRNVLALALALVVNVLLVILLTPLGFETRPATDLKTVGYIAIGTIFAGLILDLASIGLLFRRVRLASSLAIVGSILFFFPIFGDRIGSFFSVPTPPAIDILEYVLCRTARNSLPSLEGLQGEQSLSQLTRGWSTKAS